MILQDKVVLVTGGASGTGRATAIAFEAAGAKVVFSDIRSVEGEETADLIRDIGAECLFVKSDVSSEADVRELVQKAIAIYGKLDCAFNNAGIDLAVKSLHEQSVENFDKIMSINARGLFLAKQMGITFDDLGSWVPMDRIGQATEIAQAVVFLCSNAASYIMGQPFAVNGGYTAG